MDDEHAPNGPPHLSQTIGDVIVPDIIPVNANVHFKCAFDIASANVTELMTHVRQKLRSWCIRKFGSGDQTLHRSWFYIGNNPKVEPAQYYINDHQIRTVSAPSQDPQEPTCWAMEVIHPDRDERARRWSAEVALRRNEDSTVRFTTVVKHWMIPYYIGEYPDPPLPSAPAYIRTILNDKALTCKRGDAVIYSRPVNVTTRNARQVYEKLVSNERLLPFVLIAFHTDSDRLLVDPTRVADALLGNATVYALAVESAVDEMNYYLGDALSCESGTVRVYLPRLDRLDPANARLHRYLSASFIEEHGEDDIIRFLTNGLSRNGATFRLSDLTAFADIFSERRKYVIKKLATESQDRTQEASMVWEENDRLVSEASNWESLAVQYDSENGQLREENNGLKYRIDEADRVRQRIDDLQSQLAGIPQLSALPTDLAEVLERLTTLFPNRIAFTEDAKAAAEEYSNEQGRFWCKLEQLALGWKMVFDAATTLYELIFHQPSKSLEEDFDATSQFELAMNEGKQTKKDARLMKLRKIAHKGKEYDITPHIKYGNKPPKMLRLHFAIDRDAKLLLIGHFGDHLDNYSSRKR